MQHVYGHPKDNLKADVAKTSTLSGAQISFHLFLASKSSLRHSPLWPTLSVQVDDVQDLSGTIDFPTRSPTGISGIGISGTASHCSAPASPQRSRLSSFSLVFLSLSLSLSLCFPRLCIGLRLGRRAGRYFVLHFIGAWTGMDFGGLPVEGCCRDIMWTKRTQNGPPISPESF